MWKSNTKSNNAGSYSVFVSLLFNFISSRHMSSHNSETLLDNSNIGWKVFLHFDLACSAIWYDTNMFLFETNSSPNVLKHTPMNNDKILTLGNFFTFPLLYELVSLPFLPWNELLVEWLCHQGGVWCQGSSHFTLGFPSYS